jgi:hypothetical protein
MTDLIDRIELMRQIAEYGREIPKDQVIGVIARQEAVDKFVEANARGFTTDQIVHFLNRLPKYAVPKIVRCEECKHWQPHSQHGYDYDDDAFYDYCGLLVPDDDYYAVRRGAWDFCSYGERSEDE